MGERVHKLGVFSYQNVDIIRVVLGLVEPFVSIGAERFAESKGVQTLLMEENAVAAQSVKAVLD